MKKILLMSVLLFSLMLIVVPVGFAGEPPLPGESVVGPTMDGVVWITPSLSGYIDGVFLGNCNGKPFVIYGQLPGSMPTEAWQLVNYRIDNHGPAGCRSALGGEDLIITAVKNFSNDGTRVLADVDLKFVISK
jgi:hypothetical protein